MNGAEGAMRRHADYMQATGQWATDPHGGAVPTEPPLSETPVSDVIAAAARHEEFLRPGTDELLAAWLARVSAPAHASVWKVETPPAELLPVLRDGYANLEGVPRSTLYSHTLEHGRSIVVTQNEPYWSEKPTRWRDLPAYREAQAEARQILSQGTTASGILVDKNLFRPNQDDRDPMPRIGELETFVVFPDTARWAVPYFRERSSTFRLTPAQLTTALVRIIRGEQWTQQVNLGPQ
ncbi:hypothetical protein [Agromyces sp. SYSU T00194]|uniref:hypothetical protein n=1 Tax=Agromyces chitinivorans TaxID=3158560 RepID=UPI00339A3BB2